MAIGLTPTKTNPIISFYSIIDEDLSLLYYISEKYGTNNIFDTDILYSNQAMSFIGTLYNRKNKNPLYLIMKDEKYKDLLDRCYIEFIQEHESDILEYAISTEMVNLITEFKKSGEVIPTILYYNDYQLKALNEIKEFEKIDKICFEDLLKRVNHYSQFYFKLVEEIEPFKDKFYDTTVYVSSCGLNLTENNDDINIDNDLVIEFLKRNVRISIFDMYRMDMIGDIDNGNNQQ